MLIGWSSSLAAIQRTPSSLMNPNSSCHKWSSGIAALRFRSTG
jgi:hypothetical protein